MEQEQIRYKTIMGLGFKETKVQDNVYFDTYGYDYSIIELELIKNISLSWDKETRLCEMIRIDNEKDGNIIARLPIWSLLDLEEAIDFFTKTE